MTQGRTTTTTTPATGRRTLTAALLAIGGGSAPTSGTAAGIAASVTDLVPADPDAELLQIASSAELADQKMMAAHRRFVATRDRAARLESDQLFDQFVSLAEQAAAIPAQTLAGIRAKARLLYLNMSETLEKGDLTSLVLRDIGWGA